VFVYVHLSVSLTTLYVRWKHDYDAAEVMYQKAVDAAPTHGFALYNYAILKEVQSSYNLTTKCENVLGLDFHLYIM
jgi:hypothetical protein